MIYNKGRSKNRQALPLLYRERERERGLQTTRIDRQAELASRQTGVGPQTDKEDQ